MHAVTIDSLASDEVVGFGNATELVETEEDAVVAAVDVNSTDTCNEGAVETGSTIGATFANKSVWAPSMKPYSPL